MCLNSENGPLRLLCKLSSQIIKHKLKTTQPTPYGSSIWREMLSIGGNQQHFEMLHVVIRG
jgi:hypothetical protein